MDESLGPLVYTAIGAALGFVLVCATRQLVADLTEARRDRLAQSGHRGDGRTATDRVVQRRR